MHPAANFICCRGHNRQSEGICVILKNVYYLSSFLKAVSASFQIHQVLNLKYSPKVIQAWNFIENYFDDIQNKNSNFSSSEF